MIAVSRREGIIMRQSPTRVPSGTAQRSAKESAQLQQLGDRVVAARLATEMTQEELAKRSRVSGRYVQMLEAGKLNPSYLKLLAIANALGHRGRALLKLS